MPHDARSAPPTSHELRIRTLAPASGTWGAPNDFRAGPLSLDDAERVVQRLLQERDRVLGRREQGGATPPRDAPQAAAGRPRQAGPAPAPPRAREGEGAAIAALRSRAAELEERYALLELESEALHAQAAALAPVPATQALAPATPPRPPTAPPAPDGAPHGLATALERLGGALGLDGAPAAGPGARGVPALEAALASLQGELSRANRRAEEAEAARDRAEAAAAGGARAQAHALARQNQVEDLRRTVAHLRAALKLSESDLRAQVVRHDWELEDVVGALRNAVAERDAALRGREEALAALARCDARRGPAGRARGARG